VADNKKTPFGMKNSASFAGGAVPAGFSSLRKEYL
jgi:hypothetical protein